MEINLSVLLEDEQITAWDLNTEFLSERLRFGLEGVVIALISENSCGRRPEQIDYEVNVEAKS